MICRPKRSSARALLRTSNAVSVPSRDIRSANRSSCCTALCIGQTRHYTPHLTTQMILGSMWTRANHTLTCRFIQSKAQFPTCERYFGTDSGEDSRSVMPLKPSLCDFERHLCREESALGFFRNLFVHESSKPEIPPGRSSSCRNLNQMRDAEFLAARASPSR